ncbi:hypothetical protein C6Y14_12460 [Streptomyces dioscori]|uniref:Uncharacterized protein n=1 Tax=Streptomyces dioscori TaxID=2109333 RepID=A0A2P8Q9S3_9ACTN|nr:hypothetical protein [Streptomyces dioscori]PSM42984.1 hypothetical protein C6Y14_12460 [Streptomyces dioscori]
MSRVWKRRLVGLAAATSGAALFTGLNLAQPAAATDLGQITFYANHDFTGKQVTADHADYECHNLPQAMYSVENYSLTNYMDVYYKADCAPGVPDSPYTDAFLRLDGLHQSGTEIPSGFRSYRVLATTP